MGEWFKQQIGVCPINFLQLFLFWQDPLVGSDWSFALFESSPSIGGL